MLDVFQIVLDKPYKRVINNLDIYLLCYWSGTDHIHCRINL